MEILNVLKEIKSRYLSASQVRIEDFAWRRYRMNKEEVNEILIAMTRNGRLLMLEDKKVQYYRIVDETPGHEYVKENEGEYIKQELLDTVNLLFESMVSFKEEIYEELSKMKYEQTKGVSVKKDNDQRDHHLDQNAIITTLKQENKKLKEEVFAKQSVTNRLMAKTEKNIITSKNKNTEQSRNATPDKKKEKKKKEYIEIAGDSMLNGFEERGLCKNHHVKVRKHLGATSTDIFDHVKPVLRKKPDKIIIHAGKNDITTKSNLLKNVKTLAKMLKEESPTTKLCFSGLVKRFDIERGEELVEDVNNRLMNYCKQNEYDFVRNSNIGEGELGIKKLHPNKKRFENNG